ncbi:MAG: FHA domain-containing serine/threonine-protein kinase [Planctomycetota bacterium]
MSHAPSTRLVLEIHAEPGVAPRAPAELPRSGRLVIGSDATRAGLALPHAGVASVHCAIGRTKSGEWAIKDLGSPTGTFVNGERVDSKKISAGDRIELGNARLLVVDPAATRAEPLPNAGDARSSSRGAGPSSASSPARAPEPPPKAPSIPGYAIESLLGRGGMGDVYLARQTSLDRRVALKVLAKRLESDAAFVARFQAEARAAAALNHPNVVTVYDVGEETGTHYLSMEYMDRGNLEDRLARERELDWREVLHVLRDAASGLVYAEARGIVHRDIKPANLMQNHVGATKIADLGLATHAELSAPPDKSGEKPSEKKVLGTPHFMSPEQVRGERVDRRSDVYSLGASAYRLLSGKTPFEGESSRDILRAVLRDAPPPLAPLAPLAPPALVQLVERMMSKEADARPASAAELVRELDRIGAESAPATAAATRRPRARALPVFVVLAALGAAAWLTRERWLPRAQDALETAGQPSALEDDAEDEGDDDAAQGPVPSDAPLDDDQALELLEANARVALLELLSREMSTQNQRIELRALAVKYRGTTAAAEALERADSIGDVVAQEAVAAEASEARVAQFTNRLREVARFDESPPRPGATLLALRSIDGYAELEHDPDFVQARKNIELSIVDAAAAYARSVLDGAQARLARGEFDEAEQMLKDLLPLFELPEFPMGSGAAGVDKLFDVARRTRERLTHMDFARAEHVLRRTREDSEAIALAFGGQDGLERDLARFDFEAAHARVASLAPRLQTDEAAQFARALSAELESAGRALAMLAREYSAGGWRRKSFNDPRRTATRNAVGAEPTGLLYEGEGGATEKLAWSEFAGHTKELAKLFYERLAREYSGAEAASIAALLRLSAVIEVAVAAERMLVPAKNANFTDAHAREITEAFQAAQPWARDAADKQRLAREAQAAALFNEVMLDTTRGAYSKAVAGTERLLSDFQDTLVVRLLSDGTMASEATPSAPANGAEAIPTSPADAETKPGGG